MYLLDICASSEKYLAPQPIFKLGLFFFLLVRYISTLYILYTNPLSDIFFANVFLPFHKLSFHFVDGFLYCAEAFLI